MQPPPPATFVDMPFPAVGIDVSTGYDVQPKGTTAAAVNVRGDEPLTGRSRGGSRPGLVRQFAARPNGHNLIQHLNVIVDPTVDALLDAPELDPLEGIEDPSSDGSGDPADGGNAGRNPGRTVRRGGSARQPSKTRRQRIQKRQTAREEVIFDPESVAATFTTAILDDALILAFVLCGRNGGDNPAVVTVADTFLNTYTRRAAVAFNYDTVDWSFELWTAVSVSPGACVVTTTLPPLVSSGVAYGELAILEYKNTRTVSPIEGTASGAGSGVAGPGVPMTTGTITATTDNSALVAGFLEMRTGLGHVVITPAAGFTSVMPTTQIRAFPTVIHRVFAGQMDSQAVTATSMLNTDGNEQVWAAIGVSVKPRGS